jgi:hypothetical protein
VSASPEPLTSSGPSLDNLVAASVRVPGYVVYRDFAHETVMLNLRTGKYHGLNPSGGAILAALDKAPSISVAVAALAERYGRPVSDIEQDVRAFCVDLLHRSLIELDNAGG